ncbi:MAG: TIGR00296 family protein [Crenarchaeota archaeon]|nr:TIGR00296 family protein [Thermoproteota archaeon]
MSFHLSDQEGNSLIRLARKAVETYLQTGESIKPPENASKKLFQKYGVFVTISTIRNGKKHLRGCIGYPYPTNPLIEAIIDAAINASTQDPRFPPIKMNDLEKVVFEASILTPPELVTVEKPEEYVNRIKVGQDGLIVEKGFQKGLLLPQVPIEWGWKEEEFLCQCCIKAGLSPDSWKIKGLKIYRFSAIIFEEESPNGNIRRKKISAV